MGSMTLLAQTILQKTLRTSEGFRLLRRMDDVSEMDLGRFALWVLRDYKSRHLHAL